MACWPLALSVGSHSGQVSSHLTYLTDIGAVRLHCVKWHATWRTGRLGLRDHAPLTFAPAAGVPLPPVTVFDTT